MIIGVAHTKGGSGKSTVAVNLAVCYAAQGNRVLLVDADPQGSAAAWRAQREQDDIQAIAWREPTLHRDLAALAAAQDVVIVDSGGRDAAILRSVILSVDLLVTPVLPSQVDFWAAVDLEKIVAESKIYKPDLRQCYLLNQVQAGTVLAREAEELLRESTDAQLIGQLCSRMAFRRSFGAGRGVVEVDDPKAAGEMVEVYNNIKQFAKEGGE